MIRVAVKARSVPHVDVRHLAVPHVTVGRHRVWQTPPGNRPPALYMANIAGLLGGTSTSNVATFPLEGPFVSPASLAMSVSVPIKIAVGPTGVVYVLDNPSSPFGQAGSPAVYRYSGTQTTVPLTGLDSPSDVAVDSYGVLYVADSFGVIRYDGTQTTVPLTGLSYPNGVAVDSDGVLYVSDGGTRKVYRYDGTQTTVPLTGLSYPNGVAVDSDGVLYVSDGGVGFIRYDGTQTTVPLTGISKPTDVAVDGDGVLYVVDNFGVIRYDGTTQTALYGSIDSGHPIFGIAIGPAQP